MGDILNFPRRLSTNEYFGGCPTCGRTDGYINVRRDHYFVCDKHNNAWAIGANLFSDWRDETEEQWEANKRKLRSMQMVEPIYPSAPDDAA